MTEEAMPQPSGLDRSLTRGITLNWETLYWAAIIVLTLVTRMYDLGDRAMSHDESLHTYYSWKLYAGQGYVHDPMMHGPLLYHGTALFYALLGPSDFSARMFSVVLGLLLVLSPLLLRKWLGPVGAAAVGLMLLISPTVMYYTRYIRHDIHVELFTVAMAIGFIRYLDSRQGRWIVLAFAGASLAISSAEMAYINGFVLVVFIALALLTERISPRAGGLLGTGLVALGLGLLVFGSLADLGLLGSVADFSAGRPKTLMQTSLLASGLAIIGGLAVMLLNTFRASAEVTDDPGGMILADLVVGKLSLMLAFVGALGIGAGAVLSARACDAGGALVTSGFSPCRLGAALLAAGVVVLVYGLLGWLLENFDARALASAIGRAPLDALGAGTLLAIVFYVLFYTTFFKNPQGIWGLTNSIRYWLEQHNVVRGDQPFYYYGLFAPMYEFLPFFLALAAAVVYLWRADLRIRRGNDRGPEDPSAAAALFVPLLLVWSAGVFWIYSWAGEKMPWLLVHMVVPMAFLGGRLVADAFATVDWQSLGARAWGLAALAALFFGVGAFALAQMLMAQDSATVSRAAAGLLVVGALAWGLWALGRKMPRRQALVLVGLGFAGLLLVLNTRYSLAANFVNDELATEYIVYAHGTPQDKDVYEMLQDMQGRLGPERPLRIGYDNEVSWPFTWYFREDEWEETPSYLGEQPSGYAALKDLDVVLVGQPNYSKFEPYLRKDYQDVEYPRMWWPNEGYKGYTLTRDGFERLKQQITDPNLRRNWLNILLYRKYSSNPLDPDSPEKPLDDWYHHANMKMFVRRDMVPMVWPEMAERPTGLEDAASPEPADLAPELSLAVDRVFDAGGDGQAMNQPKGVALGADGALYVVDHGNSRILRFDGASGEASAIADGELTYMTEAAEGQPAQASPSAWGIEVGPDGAIYVADTWNHRVLKFVDGRQVLVIGGYGVPPSPTEGLGSFWGPRDVALDEAGNIYVADTGNKRIQMFDPAGQPLRAFGGPGLQPGQLDEPTSIAYDRATRTFYVADSWNFRIQAFDASFQPLRLWEVDGWESQDAPYKPYLEVGPGGIVVASDPFAARVWVFDSEGAPLGTLDLPMDDVGLKEPIGVAMDAEGRIYVASTLSNRVTRYAAPDFAAGGASGDATGDAAGDAAAASGTEGAGAGGPTGSPAAGEGGSAGEGSAGSGTPGEGPGGDAAAPSPTEEPGSGGAGGAGAASPTPGA